MRGYHPAPVARRCSSTSVSMRSVTCDFTDQAGWSRLPKAARTVGGMASPRLARATSASAQSGLSGSITGSSANSVLPSISVPILPQPIRHPGDQVHPLMQDRDDQSGGVFTRQAEDVMVSAPRHPQSRIQRIKPPGPALARRQSLDAAAQIRRVAAGLRRSPLLARVTNDLAQVGFRRRRQLVSDGQPCRSGPSSSSTIASTLCLDTSPASPAAIR